MEVYDEAMQLIADYLLNTPLNSEEAYQTARLSFADALGCAILALRYPACTKLLGPIVPGTVVPNGSRVPGTNFVLDPICAAFNIGCMIRWLDFNDTWLAAEWGHPSDNLGGILAVADYLSRQRISEGKAPFTVKDVLRAMIQAHEIQGGIAILNSFNRAGFDHVILVKVATAAVTTALMGGGRQEILNALSNAWIDVGALRVYRHAPNTGSRKSWAAGDATSRGVMFARMAMQGEMGYPCGLSAKHWGLYDVLFAGQPFAFQRPFGSYVMENVLFKISFPAEFHAQTAVEAALQLHSQVNKRWDEIALIEISTHESAMRIINKLGPLKNPADRDHSLQYMVAIALLHGALTADHYEEEAAQDPRIDQLRAKMKVVEHAQYSLDYHDPDKRSIANAIRVVFKDGSTLGPIEVEYPLGHRLRRQEAIPLLFDKLKKNLATHFSPEKVEELLRLFQNQSLLEAMPVPVFMSLLFSPPLK